MSADSAAAGRDALLDELRALMAAHSPPLHALVVPSEDAHQVRPRPLPPPAESIRSDRAWIFVVVVVGFSVLRDLFFLSMMVEDLGVVLWVID
jgi:hypothetical protein